MSRYLCMVQRGAEVATRPLDDDDESVAAEGYASAVALMNDERFEADASLDGLDSVEVVTFEGERVGSGRFDGADRAVFEREVERAHAGAWLAAQATRGDDATRARAEAVLRAASTAEALRKQYGG